MTARYVIVIPDGAADEPHPSLAGKTALQAARLPAMDRVAQMGIVGRSRNVPDRFLPASDVATLSLFGYDPELYYTGRAPLEAAAMGVVLGPDDWAVRCNLITLEEGRLADFTAGHITSEEGKLLLQSLHARLGWPGVEFIPGVSYRNWSSNAANPAIRDFPTRCSPPLPTTTPTSRLSNICPAARAQSTSR